MESTSLSKGLFRGEKGFASSDINNPLDIGKIIRKSIDDTYDGFALGSFTNRVVKHDIIKPPLFSMSQDGIRANVVTLARQQGRADALGMIEMARLDAEHRASSHDMRKTIQDAVVRSKDFTIDSVRMSSLDAKRYTDTRVGEVGTAIKATVSVLDNNVRILNRDPDIVGQVREAFNGVIVGNRSPLHQLARSALQEMAASSTQLMQYGSRMKDVPSRFERLAYVGSRNVAIALAATKNLETDVVENTVKLAGLSIGLHESLRDEIARRRTADLEAHRRLNSLQDSAESQSINQIGEIRDLIDDVDRSLRQRIDTVATDLRAEQTMQSDRHNGLVMDLNTKMIDFDVYVENIVDFFTAEVPKRIHQNNQNLNQQFESWKAEQNAADEARDNEINLMRADHRIMHDRIQQLEAKSDLKLRRNHSATF